MQDLIVFLGALVSLGFGAVVLAVGTYIYHQEVRHG